MARRARTSVPQPRKVPGALMPILPVDLDAGPLGLLNPHLLGSYRVHRQLLVLHILPLGLFRIYDANPFVTHRSSFRDARSYRIFKYKMLSDKPSVAALDAITGFDPLKMP